MGEVLQRSIGTGAVGIQHIISRLDRDSLCELLTDPSQCGGLRGWGNVGEYTLIP